MEIVNKDYYGKKTESVVTEEYAPYWIVNEAGIPISFSMDKVNKHRMLWLTIQQMKAEIPPGERYSLSFEGAQKSIKVCKV